MIKKSFLALATLLFTVAARGQNGYVKLMNDSILVGYVRSFQSVTDGKYGLEIWKTKTDKSPRRVFKSSIQEYAIKKDTFKVLHSFIPFSDDDLFYDNYDAPYRVRGKISLLELPNLNIFYMMGPTGMGPGGVGSAGGGFVSKKNYETSTIFVLEDIANGQFKALATKKKELRESLLDFFPESFLDRYEKTYGKIRHKTLKKFIEFYNSK